MKHKILFVDDEQKLLDGYKVLLRKQRKRWEMFFAISVDAALEILETEKIDLVISDVRMPKKNGIMLMNTLKNKYPDIIRVLLSGYSDQELTIQATPSAHQYISKPCEPEKLVQAIERNINLIDLVKSKAIRDIVGEIGNLPSSTQIYNELSQALEDPTITAKMIAKIIEQDIAISAKVLQITNSSFFGIAKKVIKVESAVNYLGSRILKSIVLTEEIAKLIGDSKFPDGMSLASIQRHSMLTAQLAKRLIAGYGDEDTAYMAGLLHDVGLLIVGSKMREETQRMVELAIKEKKPLETIEYEQRGTSHGEIGGYLLGLWGLPIEVVEAVAYHNKIDNFQGNEFGIPDAVHFADRIASKQVPPYKFGANYTEINLTRLNNFANLKEIVKRIETMIDELNSGEEHE